MSTWGRTGVAALAIGVVLAAPLAVRPALSEAVYTDVAPVSANSFTTGVWSTFWLHSNPTPPVGDTNQQVNLAMSNAPPTAPALFNYDVDVDPHPGRTIVLGGGGANEYDPGQYLNWRTAPLTAPRAINGTVRVVLWARPAAGGSNGGTVRAMLRDFNPATSTYTLIGARNLRRDNWTGGSNAFVQRAINIPAVNYTLQAGHQLELKLTVPGTSLQDMWFAYDVRAHPSRVELP